MTSMTNERGVHITCSGTWIDCQSVAATAVSHRGNIFTSNSSIAAVQRFLLSSGSNSAEWFEFSWTFRPAGPRGNYFQLPRYDINVVDGGRRQRSSLKHNFSVVCIVSLLCFVRPVRDTRLRYGKSILSAVVERNESIYPGKTAWAVDFILITVAFPEWNCLT